MENLELRDTAALTQAVNDLQNTFTDLEREVGKVQLGRSISRGIFGSVAGRGRRR